ncbi:tryptophan 7-halogenase [Exilibacterium tricleocarpae]|uniref:Tryptophan 7-halogenase n=1 Tax=Exilibacterium tricleocarpae TaxID=2591008 RepID=A0A545TP22_9GAMM|nr:tryptophan halogenase family protein [Exilibacterium tricleocarpae]TQV78921.1 tryptophan 7-halogenase [Exilibacterium tricleocarpae]
MDSRDAIKHIIIVGGGAAGWLSACHLAKRLHADRSGAVKVTLVESSEIPTIGVGEGTVPAIRQSLRSLGISESEFVRECDATFKQSIKFVNWLRPEAEGGDCYHHVFDYPNITDIDLTPYWLLGAAEQTSYVDAVSVQGRICDRGLAPKNITQAEYEGITNYAYHLDAAKFSRFLTRHATERLGVRHVLASVQDVELNDSGEISAIVTDSAGTLSADFFVDCTGFASLLLGRKMAVGFTDKSDVLFVDHAVAMQVPYAAADTPIPSHTIATAQEAGWIWDIGLSARRGTGYVYSTRYTDHERAERVLRAYIGSAADKLDSRRIPMRVGYREKFWHKNCVAIGLSQGFVEPLEATGLLVYDATARMLAEQFPACKAAMPEIARRFNRHVQYGWDRVIDFIKLHYYLSKRDDSDFWRDNRRPDSAPASLLDNLALWRYQPPSDYDFPSRLDIFNLSNYLYVLYGMEFFTDMETLAHRFPETARARQAFAYTERVFQQVAGGLPGHRELIERVRQFGFQKV